MNDHRLRLEILLEIRPPLFFVVTDSRGKPGRAACCPSRLSPATVLSFVLSFPPSPSPFLLSLSSRRTFPSPLIPNSRFSVVLSVRPSTKLPRAAKMLDGPRKGGGGATRGRRRRRGGSEEGGGARKMCLVAEKATQNRNTHQSQLTPVNKRNGNCCFGRIRSICQQTITHTSALPNIYFPDVRHFGRRSIRLLTEHTDTPERALFCYLYASPTRSLTGLSS